MALTDKKISRIALKERLYRRRFLVPNAVTLANMFCGFLAIIYAAAEHYDKATIAIGFAILLDGLDGRVARRLNATSKFGVEFDSFSDLVSFGIAPALVVYDWCFRAMADDFGVFITFIYAICAASRLARFNIADENLKAFTGLPTPGAAAMVASVINLSPVAQHTTATMIGGTILMPLLGYLMVSKIEFFSVKLLRVNAFGLFARILIGAMIGLIWYNNQIGFLVLSTAYCVSGPYNYWLKRKSRVGITIPGAGSVHNVLMPDEKSEKPLS